MNGPELVGKVIAIHSTAFGLSLAAVYAVLGDRFIRPIIERADDACAKFEGGLAKELARTLQPFTQAGRSTTAEVTLLCDADGKPLKSAAITGSASSLSSEEFRTAVREFLSTESVDFRRYWDAVRLRRWINRLWCGVRFIIAALPVSAFLGATLFWLFSENVIEPPELFWLVILAGLPLLPAIMALLALPIIAVLANRLDSLARS